jgi:hypothetical protein
MAEEAIQVQTWEWPDCVRDHHACVISDWKWPLKKKTGNGPKTKVFFLTINHKKNR